MKILKDNYNNIPYDEQVEPYPRNLICEYCGSSLEYEEADLRMGAWGCMFLDCPLCGGDNMLEDNEKNITLTVDNIEFPTHYYHTSKKTGAVDCCNNEEISKRIRDGVNYLRKNKEEFYWFCQSGNLRVEILRWGGDEMYEVIVTNDFYGMEIPFEAKDY